MLVSAFAMRLRRALEEPVWVEVTDTWSEVRVGQHGVCVEGKAQRPGQDEHRVGLFLVGIVEADAWCDCEDFQASGDFAPIAQPIDPETRVRHCRHTLALRERLRKPWLGLPEVPQAAATPRCPAEGASTIYRAQRAWEQYTGRGRGGRV